jgi:hypothetical protein
MGKPTLKKDRQYKNIKQMQHFCTLGLDEGRVEGYAEQGIWSSLLAVEQRNRISTLIDFPIYNTLKVLVYERCTKRDIDSQGRKWKSIGKRHPGVPGGLVVQWYRAGVKVHNHQDEAQKCIGDVDPEDVRSRYCP